MQPADPTPPEEIRQLSKEIRSRWSEAETRKRAAWCWSPLVLASVVDDDVIEAAGAN